MSTFGHTCKGICFRQLEVESYPRTKQISYSAGCGKCCLIECRRCGFKYPEWVLDYENRFCIDCAVAHEASKRQAYRDQQSQMGQRCCLHCGRKLVPVGSSRTNGANHNDWTDRKYHKKCWRELYGQY